MLFFLWCAARLAQPYFFPLTVLGDLALGTFRQKIQKSQSGGSFFVCKKNDSAVQKFGGGGCM
jgi:hypothetical protein